MHALRNHRSALAAALLTSVLILDGSQAAASQKEGDFGTILFFGDSLTAGYQLNPDRAFPALIQEKIDSLGLPYRAVNAGVSGETSADGLSRIDWVLRNPVDILVLELGANDAMRGLPLDSTERNLQAIVDKVREKHPNARLVVAGMMMPQSIGPEYARRFQSIFAELAGKNRGVLIPFLLEEVAGEPHLNLPDGIHPNPEGHKIVAENVWKVLRPLLEE